MRTVPDVYVVGNQSALQVEKRTIAGKDVLLVALPSFASSGTAVVVDLETLSSSVMEFNTESIDGEEEKAKQARKGEEEEEQEEEFVIEENIENDEEWSVCWRKQDIRRESGAT